MMRIKLKAMRRFVFILLSLVGVIAVGCNNEQPSTPAIKLSHSIIDAWYDAFGITETDSLFVGTMLTPTSLMSMQIVSGGRQVIAIGLS